LMAAVLESVIVWPECGTRAVETMPADDCQHFYRCTGRSALFAQLPGDCCVFCSYGDQPCLPKHVKRQGV
jgi:hypothetical protein